MKSILLSLFILVVGWIAGAVSFGMLFGQSIEEETEQLITYNKLSVLNDVRADVYSAILKSDKSEGSKVFVEAICNNLSSLDAEASAFGKPANELLDVRKYSKLVSERYKELISDLDLKIDCFASS